MLYFECLLMSLDHSVHLSKKIKFYIKIIFCMVLFDSKVSEAKKGKVFLYQYNLIHSHNL